uniref:skin secretory protein xP2-like n=1 Tax=Jaculus jaculus TaxID=51337 RepID=UPI001E1B0604|nr:skin secretory protein xP2-like [Jaculus jaculus]
MCYVEALENEILEPALVEHHVAYEKSSSKKPEEGLLENKLCLLHTTSMILTSKHRSLLWSSYLPGAREGGRAGWGGGAARSDWTLGTPPPPPGASGGAGPSRLPSSGAAGAHRPSARRAAPRSAAAFSWLSRARGGRRWSVERRCFLQQLPPPSPRFRGVGRRWGARRCSWRELLSEDSPSPPSSPSPSCRRRRHRRRPLAPSACGSGPGQGEGRGGGAPGEAGEPTRTPGKLLLLRCAPAAQGEAPEPARAAAGKGAPAGLGGGAAGLLRRAPRGRRAPRVLCPGEEDTPAVPEKTFPADSVGAAVAGSPGSSLARSLAPSLLRPLPRALPAVGAEVELKFAPGLGWVGVGGEPRRPPARHGPARTAPGQGYGRPRGAEAEERSGAERRACRAPSPLARAASWSPERTAAASG